MTTKIIAYKKTKNLGDAIQAIAMNVYLRSIEINSNIETDIVYRQNMCVDHFFNDSRLIVSGWHRANKEPLPKNATFISIHTDEHHLKNINQQSIIGCRDSWTRQNCRNLGINSVITGCVTINLEADNSHKTNNILYIDSIHTSDVAKSYTQVINKNLSWDDQILMAKERLNQLRSASLVYTTRLHILIPCIAMEVPVVLDKIPTYQPERFSFFLDYIPLNQPIEKSSGIKENLLDIWKKNSKVIMEKYLNDQ